MGGEKGKERDRKGRGGDETPPLHDLLIHISVYAPVLVLGKGREGRNGRGRGRGKRGNDTTKWRESEGKWEGKGINPYRYISFPTSSTDSRKHNTHCSPGHCVDEISVRENIF